MNAISNNIRWQDYVFSCLSDCLSVWKKEKTWPKRCHAHIILKNYIYYVDNTIRIHRLFQFFWYGLTGHVVMLHVFSSLFSPSSQTKTSQHSHNGDVCLFVLFVEVFFIVWFCVTFLVRNDDRESAAWPFSFPLSLFIFLVRPMQCISLLSILLLIATQQQCLHFCCLILFHLLNVELYCTWLATF